MASDKAILSPDKAMLFSDNAMLLPDKDMLTTGLKSDFFTNSKIPIIGYCAVQNFAVPLHRLFNHMDSDEIKYLFSLVMRGCREVSPSFF